jgi:hypothetical protein
LLAAYESRGIFMSDSDKKSFWSTLPGVITAIAALISAIGGILLTFHQIGWMGAKTKLEPPQSTTQLAIDSKNLSIKDLTLFEDKFSTPSLDTKWQIITGDWYSKDGVLNGVSRQKTSFGGPVWAILTLDKQLPRDYSVSFKTKIVEGEVSELMLRLSNNRYVRVYLYSIDQALMLGDGEFLKKNMPGSIGLDEIMDNLGGGVTVAQHGFPIFKERWYSIKVTAVSNNYSISLGGQEIINYTDLKNELNPHGTIGFISNGHMQYDDVTIIDKTKVN